MAIQLRYGEYDDLDPNKLVMAEPAVVISGDPNTDSGQAMYVCFGNGNIKRMIAFEDLDNEAFIEEIKKNFYSIEQIDENCVFNTRKVAGYELNKDISANDIADSIKKDNNAIAKIAMGVNPTSLSNIKSHNLATTSHSDIRASITTLAEDISNMSNTLADGIICSTSGELIHIEDASNKKIVSQKIFGKSVQDGTPTIDAPIDIVSIGDNGNIIEGIFGANLFDAHALSLGRNYSLDVSEDGNVITATGGTSGSYTMSEYKISADVLRGKTIYLIADSIESANADAKGGAQFCITTNEGEKIYRPTGKSVVVPNNADTITFGIYTNNTPSALTEDNTVTIAGLRVTLDPNQSWTPYSGSQIITLSTPNGLKGIPVTSGGNYVDENGQMWICDTIEKYADGTGKLIQRIGKEIISGTPNFTETSITNRFAWFGGLKTTFVGGEKNALSNFSPWSSWAITSGSMTLTQKSLYFKSSITMSVDEVNALFTELIASDNPPVVMGILATPIETELTAEELEELEKLHTYKLITNVITDSNARVELEHVKDTKTYIDNKFEELKTALVAVGSEV